MRSGDHSMLRVELDDDLIAVGRAEDRRDLLGAEAGIERRAQRVGVDAERGRLVAVDHQRRLQGVVLQIGGDVGEVRAVRRHRVGQLLRPRCRSSPLSSALHDQLILALPTRARRCCRFCTGMHVGVDARHVGELPPQIRQHRLEVGTLVLRLQLDEQPAVVQRLDRRHRRRRPTSRHARHRANARRRRPPAPAASTIASKEMSWRASVVTESWPISSCGKKPFGEISSSQTDSAAVPRKTSNTSERVAQAEGRAPRRSRAGRCPRFAASRHGLSARRPRHRQQPRAQHRRQRQRHEHRGQDRDRHHHRELVEDAADDAAHQQHRDEHRHQRDRDRDDGEADLARALQRRLEGGQPILLHVAEDVLQHDDGVVDDEADGQRQPHQRDVVDGEAEQIHRAERGDQRDRHRDGGDDGRRHPAQEQEDHQHHQRDGQQPA